MATDVTVKRYSGNVSDLENEMIGMDDSVDGDTGNKMFFYKDQDGTEHKCANINEPARFTSTEVTNLEVTGTLTVSDQYTQTDFYVSSTGSDTTGDGTEALPFATVENALSYVPQILKTRYNIWIENGTYSSFPAHIKRECVGEGRLMIARNEAPVDVLAGPYTVVTATYSDSGSNVKISVSGTPFSDDAIRSSIGGTVQVRMLTGSAAGFILPVHLNTTSVITALSTVPGITAGDTFKIIEPGVKVKTTGRHIFEVDGNRRYGVFVMDGLAFESSFSEFAYVTTNPAYESCGDGVACFLNCTFRSETDKAYVLAMSSASINGMNPISFTDIPYYDDISGSLPYGDDFFYLHHSFQANAMSAGTSGTTFAQHVGPFVINGANGTKIYQSGTTVRGLCSRNMVYAEARLSSFANCAAGLLLAQYGIVYVEGLSTYSWETYSVKAEKDVSITLYNLHTLHTVAKNCAVWLNYMGKMPICEDIYQDTADEYIFKLGFNCRAELTDALSVNGTLADIYFTRGQKSEYFPPAGYSVTDGEASHFSLIGSVSGSANPVPLLPMGVSVESVQTDAPGSPSVGEWYLIQGGSGSYEKKVIYRKNSTDWEEYSGYDGAFVFNKATSKTLKYDTSTGRNKWSSELFHDRVEIEFSGSQTVNLSGTNNFYAYSDDADILSAAGEGVQFEMLLTGTVQETASGQKFQYVAKQYGIVVYPEGSSPGGYEQYEDIKVDSLSSWSARYIAGIGALVRQIDSGGTNPGTIRLNVAITCSDAPTEFIVDWKAKLVGYKKYGVDSFC